MRSLPAADPLAAAGVAIARRPDRAARHPRITRRREHRRRSPSIEPGSLRVIAGSLPAPVS
ncbi:hypothetical protein C6P75_21890 [Burkholderia multivorans]|nr:hypothetical protein C6P75_21890 [Burkholderia multivorans]